MARVPAQAISQTRKNAAKMTPRSRKLSGSPIPKTMKRKTSTMAYSTAPIWNACFTRSRAKKIPSAVHYPLSLHQQPAYAAPYQGQSFPAAEKLAREVLSLPMSADLAESDQDLIAQAIEWTSAEKSFS